LRRALPSCQLRPSSQPRRSLWPAWWSPDPLWNDVFKPITFDATIPTRNHRFFDNGATDSGEGNAFFIGHGGKYEVIWDWNVLI
jgi:hypothetical protein